MIFRFLANLGIRIDALLGSLAREKPRRVFFMAESIPNSPRHDSRSFRQIVDAFLGGEGLPFAQVLSSDRIERVFLEHGGVLGLHGYIHDRDHGVVFSFPSPTRWQGGFVPSSRSTRGLVSPGASLPTPSEDTGNYCRAREKLSCAALRELSCEIAEEMEEKAEPKWLWKEKHHAKLVDGFTFTMPDTPKPGNLPTAKSQKPGVGLPIARVAAILSLATACVMDLAIAPYQGKETGESAPIDARFTSTRRHRSHGSILLFIHDDRSSARPRHANLCTQTSSEA